MFVFMNLTICKDTAFFADMQIKVWEFQNAQDAIILQLMHFDVWEFLGKVECLLCFCRQVDQKITHFRSCCSYLFGCRVFQFSNT